MGIPRLVEVNYHLFMREYKASGDQGCRIEPTDKDAWKAYVQEHDVKEASAMAIARSQGEDMKAVIINCGGTWDGYYIYSRDEQVALKFDRT